MMEDPRDNKPQDPNEVLTEDSDDALADLEKEFEVRKQKLMEERARKKERAAVQVQIERSPSPERRKPFISNQFPAVQPQVSAVTQVAKPKAKEKPFQKIQTSSLFASRLHSSKNPDSKVTNFSERLFEFENVPELNTVTQESIDIISGETLSRRYISEAEVKKILGNVKILRTTKLLAKVFPPKFEEPQYMNWCFTGMVLHKSDPKTAVNKKKFMALRVGNFLHTVDVYLFGDAFTKYWTIRCGDVIVILNPTIKKYGSGFNLAILDDLNNVLEIGTLKNFGHCSETTRSGDRCKYVIDLLKNSLCSFHEEKKFKHGPRMELQGSVKPKAPLNKQGSSGQAYMSTNSNSMFVQYANAGFHEKDLVFAGGEQFDHSKYDKPIKESSYAKIKKKRANENLRNKLVQTSAPARLDDLEKLGIVQKNDLESKERQSSFQKLRKQAFKGKFLNGMGYDPTQERMKHVEKMKASTSVEELRSLGKSKRVSLQASEEDRKQKQRKWKEAFKLTKSKGDSAFIPESNVGTSGSAAKNKRCNPNILHMDAKKGTCEIGVDCAGEYESDIEIAFACDADENQYKNVIAAPLK